MVEGVLQMPLDKIQMTSTIRDILGSREVQMVVVLIPG